MSAARPSTADTSADRPARTGLSPLQLVGSALAAATSAVVASFFGVAGTVIGAALASVITTISATLYSVSLRKTNERLHALSTRLAGRRPAAAAATQVLPKPATRQLPAALDPRRRPPARSRRLYVRLAAGAAAVFVAAMVIVTGIELIGHRPVSALVTGSSSKGTTVGDLTTAGSQKAVPTTPAPSTPATAPATPSGTSQPTETPSSSSAAVRTSSAAATPSSTAESSSAAPTTASQDSSSPTP
jgi:hypothetical protein